jgi:hypothetical protein
MIYQIVLNPQVHVYDDTQIFASSHDSEDLIDKLNSDLGNVMDWLTVNKLQSHAKKTKFMLIGSAHNLSAKGNEVTYYYYYE